MAWAQTTAHLIIFLQVIGVWIFSSDTLKPFSGVCAFKVCPFVLLCWPDMRNVWFHQIHIKGEICDLYMFVRSSNHWSQWKSKLEENILCFKSTTLWLLIFSFSVLQRIKSSKNVLWLGIKRTCCILFCPSRIQIPCRPVHFPSAKRTESRYTRTQWHFDESMPQFQFALFISRFFFGRGVSLTPDNCKPFCAGLKMKFCLIPSLP